MFPPKGKCIGQDNINRREGKWRNLEEKCEENGECGDMRSTVQASQRKLKQQPLLGLPKFRKELTSDIFQ